MNSELQFECLLVSRDPLLHCVINKVLHDFSMVVEPCLSSSKACKAIAKGTYDLIVIDWEGDASLEFVHSIWNLRKRKKPTLVAISNDASPIPGAHILLRKPVTLDSVTGSVKTAYSRMLLDYRLNTRHPALVHATATDETGRTFAVVVTDIGDSGVGLSCKESLLVGSILSFSMQLPETHSVLHVQMRIIWTRDYGTAGCRILSLPPIEHQALREWLKNKARVKKPLIPV